MANAKPSRPKKPTHSVKRGRKLRTFELTNIQRPIDHKMKALSSRAVVHKKRGEHKKTVTPTHAKVKTVSTPETRSIAKAKVAIAKAARPPSGHRHTRRVRTTKFTNIAKAAKSANKEPTPPKIHEGKPKTD